MRHNNGELRQGLGAIGILGALIVFMAAAIFWGGVYYLAALIWRHL